MKETEEFAIAEHVREAEDSHAVPQALYAPMQATHGTLTQLPQVSHRVWNSGLQGMNLGMISIELFEPSARQPCRDPCRRHSPYQT